MGIPKTHSAPTDPGQTTDATAAPTCSSNTASTSDAPQPTATPSSPSDLPPAALDLAAKLFDLARAGETTTLTQYLQAGIPVNLTNHSGDTLLMLAAYHGHAATVQALLDAGADADARNGRGQSPLAGAVFKGHDEVVRTLFAAGASTAAGRPSAVDTARLFQRADICELFGVEMGDSPVGGLPPGMAPGSAGDMGNGGST